MSQPRTLFNGFIIMFVGVTISLMLMATVGQVGDRTITILVEDVGAFEVNADWAANVDKIYTFQSFLFFLCALPGILGVTTFILSAVRRQRYDIQQEPQVDFTPTFEGGR